GAKGSNTHLLIAKCCSGVFPSLQQSMGPPGTPSKTVISHGPVMVRAGNTKYSPTPGIKLNDTAVMGVRGTMFLTYVRANARIGLSNGDFSASRSNSRLISPFPAATITK